MRNGIKYLHLLCALMIVSVSCGSPPADNSFAWSGSMATLFTFDAQGGSFCSKDGVCIHIPKDAVTAATQLQGRKLSPLQEGVGPVYELEIVGANQKLLKTVEIELPVPSDKQQEQLVVAFQEGDVWKEVPTTNGTLNKTRRGTTEHFSQWTLLSAASCQSGVCLKKGCKDGDTQACYSGPAGTKGVGPCQEGTQTCNKGTWGPCTGEITPTTETCDDKDNDCDGQTDEDFTDKGKACSIGTGECKADGTYVCKTDGSGLGCSAKAGTPVAETCDGKDNDCNGQIDDVSGGCGVCKDGDTQACYGGPAGTKGVGPCQEGSQTCNAGKWGPCTGEVTPQTEICDTKDNDCNGQIDDVSGGCGVCKDGDTQACYSGPAGTKGVGSCQEGSQTCNAGKWGPCTGEITPTTETCDDKDNDCDGQTDEDFADKGKACSVGVGECKADGTFACKADGSGLECPAKAGTPVAETCDGKDNDCNGQIDDGVTCPCKAGDTRSCYTGPGNTLGVGRCRRGTQACQGSQWGACSATTPTTESCNGVDDDCDGEVDEGLSGCAPQSNCPNNPLPECCNGKDDDCDGMIDENLQCPTYGSVAFVKEAPFGRTNVIMNVSVLKVDSDNNVYIAATEVQTRLQFETPTGTKITVPSGINNAFVAKINPQGKLLWSAEAQQGTKAYFTNLKVSANGEVYVRLMFQGTFLASTYSLTVRTNGAALYAKISNSGKWEWIQMRDNDYTIYYYHQIYNLMDIDSQGNMYFLDETKSSKTLRKFDTTGKLTSFQISAEELLGVDNAGNIIVRQTSGMEKYASTAQFLWSNTIDVKVRRFVFDAQNNIYAVGPSPDVIKVSPQGKLIYHKNLSLLKEKTGTGRFYVAVTPGGDLYIVYSTISARDNIKSIKTLTGQVLIQKGSQGYTMKVDTNGTFQWIQTLSNGPVPYYPEGTGGIPMAINLDKQGRPVAVIVIGPTTDWQPTLKLDGPTFVRWHPHPYTHLAGRCAYGSCKPGDVLCQSKCVSLSTDINNCGACGNQCSKTEVCQSGTCVTPKGNCKTTICNGACTDVLNDKKNCGGCGLACPEKLICRSGRCYLPEGECTLNLTKCGDVCVDLQTNMFHCGACNNVCPNPIGCKAGQCAGLRAPICAGKRCDGTCFFDSVSGQEVCMPCSSNQMICYDRAGIYACAPLSTTGNCDGCGITCPEGLSCFSGKCKKTSTTCKSDEQQCTNNSCQRTTNNNGHCGGCFVQCPPDANCGNSLCYVSNSPTQQCNGQTTNIDTDVFHCGGCNSPCREGQTCWGGKCGDSCPYGFLRCREHCIDPINDNNDCGTCGNKCPKGRYCRQGSCQCPLGKSECNGLCYDLNTDPKNCGTCGNVCPTNKPLCGGGQCFPQ